MGIIKNYSSSQDEIIRSILDLHLGGADTFDIDTTFSKGVFYKNIVPPKYRFDMYPQIEGVLPLTFPLPFKDSRFNSIMFDPPFVVSSGPSMVNPDPGTNIISSRFSCYPNIEALFKSYEINLREYYRLLDWGGILVFKCQATVSSGKNYFIPEWLMMRAYNLGFYPLDKFYLVANSRIISGKHKQQKHARKYTSVFWVFKKCEPKVNYAQINDMLDIL